MVANIFPNLQTSKREITHHEKVQHLHYLIESLLPFLKQICEVQRQEIEIEAKIQGAFLLSINEFCFKKDNFS